MLQQLQSRAAPPHAQLLLSICRASPPLASAFLVAIRTNDDHHVAAAPSCVQICLCCRLHPGVGCCSAQTHACIHMQAACTWPLAPQPSVQWLASVTLLGQLSVTTAALQVQIDHHQAESHMLWM
jgi:hypothetical protein